MTLQKTQGLQTAVPGGPDEATRDALAAAMPSTADHVLSVIETDHQQLIVQSDRE